jgi:hypothetical protein
MVLMRGFVGAVGALLITCACGQTEDTATSRLVNDPASGTDAVGDETPTAGTPVDWVRVEAHCGYSFLAPPGVNVRRAMGTDSCVDGWTTRGCMQRGDYGGYSSDLSEYVGEPEYASTRENIQGREATLVTVTMAGLGRIAAAHFPEVGVDGVTLTVWASCEDTESQQTALTSFRTITFGL